MFKMQKLDMQKKQFFLWRHRIGSAMAVQQTLVASANHHHYPSCFVM